MAQATPWPARIFITLQRIAMRILVSCLVVLLFPLQAAAQSTCLEHPALIAYTAARASELPALDNLSESQKSALESAYEKAWLATVDQFSTIAYNSEEIEIPNLSNRFNLEQVLAGERVSGALGIYADSALAFVSPSNLAIVADELDRARAAIRGSDPTFAEYNDEKYRDGVTQLLLKAGCPADLEDDYALPRWNSP